MNNKTHVGLVDTHAKSNGGTDHMAIVIGPLILHKLPFRIAESGMVRCRFDLVGR